MTHQMPTVEDMLGRWHANCLGARILRRAATAEDAYAWMRAELWDECISRGVGQQVDRPMALQVRQQGAIGAPTTHCPIILPKDGGRCYGRIGKLADETQEGIGAGWHTELGSQPCPRFAPEREPELLQCDGQAYGTLSGWPHQLWQVFCEGLSGAGSVQAAKTADVQDQAHGIIPQRKIARAARIVAMNARRGYPAVRAVIVKSIALRCCCHLAPR